MKESLTDREREIAELITWGASYKEVACILNLSVETVKEHIKHIKMKLGINKATEIGAYIFCTEYDVPVHRDKLGRIRNIVAAITCVLAFILVEYQQLNVIRTTTTRNVRISAKSRQARRGKNDYYFAYEYD
ncbi:MULTISPECIES: response regulator transcription factor [Butyricimonas]|uniref:response regulator transcription factor n=1 Tax=Butyricimonas TaxID=574697 RepID=UPI001D08D66C|nr:MULTISPECIES: helix-turn-helix transcriptional regulator [Butyricimonas]MBS5624664.1 helix-turn-helix transcriptional regulator [Porphyromonadaceae bacterium]MCB6972562.1 helix-turn-helix transcriptional regulator [Butyricimonas synergistica]MCG4519571.1 helix-turn-helix transcriptional regulator [Butyricimonas sp. DFI.6.44]